MNIELTNLPNDKVQITVFDLLGNRIISENRDISDAAAQNITIPTSGITTGQYFITINSGGILVSEKFIIMK